MQLNIKGKLWLKKLIMAGVVLLLLYILLVIGFVSIPDINDFLTRQDFNSEQWKTWEETEENCCLRWQMVHDLTEKHNLVGMKRSELIELLGEPDSEIGNDLYYYLGMTGHGIDPGSLILYLNNSSVVERYIVWWD